MPSVTTIPFLKISGAGNDFIAVNNWSGRFKPKPSLAEWTKTVCDRRRSVGADGVLLLERSKQADVRMRIINADGSEAEMCGNGVRCLAQFALMERAVRRSRMSVETLSGVKTVTIKGGMATVDMGVPGDERPAVKLSLGDQVLEGYYVNTGVPHTVVLHKPHGEEVRVWGSHIRHHKAFGPKGTNADFVWKAGPRAIHARVFERGVEGETLACGTGACASALIAVHRGLVTWPVEVITSGGERLSVEEAHDGRLFMTGPIRIVYEGILHRDAWIKESSWTDISGK